MCGIPLMSNIISSVSHTKYIHDVGVVLGSFFIIISCYGCLIEDEQIRVE